MEHKWDDHPYVLVAHVTLLRKLDLPPNGMMHPQLGRALRHPSQVLARRGGRKSKTLALKGIEVIPPVYRCSKCPEEMGLFDDKGKFYAHVLVCGGDEAWDPSKKKGKTKKKSSNTANNSGVEKKKTEISGEFFFVIISSQQSVKGSIFSTFFQPKKLLRRGRPDLPNLLNRPLSAPWRVGASHDISSPKSKKLPKKRRRERAKSGWGERKRKKDLLL